MSALPIPRRCHLATLRSARLTLALLRLLLRFLSLSHPLSCTFTIATKKTLFETGKLTGQTGFILTPSPHEPSHNHPAPFHPLDLDAENQRRLTLHFNDSSLSSPPGLIPLAQPSAPATLATFLATIHPSLATPHVLALLESNGLPPNETPAEDLLSLDGEVYGLFKDIHGLDAIIPAMVQDAVSRANKRRIAGDEGMDGSLDAGEQLRLEQFIQSSIEAQERKQREESRGTPMTLC